MRIEIDKEEYKDLIETKEEFLKTVRKLDNITIENIKLTDKLQEKEQECEELKAEIKHYKQIAQYHGNLSVKYTNKSAKYKQTLAEIKEIAEENIRIADLEGLNGVYRRGLAKQILQKISEVNNER